ncbi:MAG: hypothetical protein IJ428_02490 [Clostridia bacterium]|nr:hypothetical protein [Clostridia bacterium]
MEKKYKILTAAIAAMLAAAIMIVHVSADTYVPETFRSLYWASTYTDGLVRSRADSKGFSLYIGEDIAALGALFDIDIKDGYLYEIDLTYQVDFYDGDSDTYYDYDPCMPTEPTNVSFINELPESQTSNTITYRYNIGDVTENQTNSDGDYYHSLVSTDKTAKFVEETDDGVYIYDINYHFVFSTLDGFIDNLGEGILYMVPWFNIDGGGVAVDVCAYELSVNITYDPEGQSYEDALIDQLGDITAQTVEINNTLANIKAQNTETNELLEAQISALESQLEALEAQTTEIVNINTKLNSIQNTMEELPDKVGDVVSDKLEEHDQNVLQQVQDGGNEFLKQLTDELGGIVDADGVTNAFESILSFLGYEGRQSKMLVPALSIPAMSGVTSTPIKIWDGGEIDFSEYVSMIPAQIMTLVQWIMVVLIVISAVLSLMKLINQFLQGRSIGGKDGDG